MLAFDWRIGVPLLLLYGIGFFLQGALNGKEGMVIAHRMRTIANADKVVVLDGGHISEMGKPAELLQKGGLYAHLVALQQGV